MKQAFARPLAICLIVLFACSPAWATCGGGGGVGGMSAGSSAANPQVYYVPWKVRGPNDAAPTGLVLYWFPRTDEEVKKSSLRASRVLSLYAAQCVSMEMADYRTPAGQKLIGEAQPPLVVLATPDGTAVQKLENTDGLLKVADVEKLVGSEVKRRADALEEKLKTGRDKAKAGDNAAAIQLFRAVLAEQCMFPKPAKEASKELKKLGVNDVADVPPAPVFAARASAQIERTMRNGLKAEIAGRYAEAASFYNQAHWLDQADATPLRYLGEVYRHHTGEWAKARTAFTAILKMPADPLSRAVAQHGLGKMTIHEGEFKQGLALLEASVQTYPLPLTYRNLAVYWNSEGDQTKTGQYMQQALALDPADPYNLVFAAVLMAGTGRGDKALRIARANEALLPASYNLAAVYAQTGQRAKALALLRRHFFQYERYQAVRAKEMMEARVDAVFAGLRADPAFVALTDGADGKLPVPAMGVRTGMNR